MTKEEINEFLLTDDHELVEDIYTRANDIRCKNFGDEVALRGIIEISNKCDRFCGYCGINHGNRHLERYMMSINEILDAASQFCQHGLFTVVLQAGETACLETGFITDTINELKALGSLAITLSLGERDIHELEKWRKAGAERYLLKFETSNPELFNKVHPPKQGKNFQSRIEMLKILRDLGYETGSGNIVGLPGQTITDLVEDICFFRELDLDMIGIGPYIPHPMTSLYKKSEKYRVKDEEIIQNSYDITMRVLALARIICPLSNIPSTQALRTVDPTSGLRDSLSCGANVIMPDMTMEKYRQLYDIYPKEQKSGISESLEVIHTLLKSINRSVSSTSSPSKNYLYRVTNKALHQ